MFVSVCVRVSLRLSLCVRVRVRVRASVNEIDRWLAIRSPAGQRASDRTGE